jgi:hypothetical protein
VGETGLAHAADGLDAPGDADVDIRLQLLGGFCAVVAKDAGDGVGEVEALSVGGEAQRLDLRDAVMPLFEKIVFQ